MPNYLKMLEGIHVKENEYLFLNILISTFVSQSQHLDPIHGFLLVFCIDHKYLKWWTDDVLEKRPFPMYNFFSKEHLNI